ncbi:MAG: uncharacterized protein KVP18_004165 [Porospora cf. gigantea A]|uniref:uncharacterized protein n=1 Tax=Porospora cf. gigantea A TaxID=2853593 RepID=UPI003559B248|nr:MAG: hypothetical protein KVP18_004165 [Porospora cf. gigantea A]
MPAATLTVNPDSHMWEEFPLNDTSWDEMTEAAVSSAGFDEGPAEISESSPVPLPEDPLLEFYFDKESPVELLEGAVRLKEIVAGEPSPRNFFQLPIASLTGPSGVNAWRDCGCGVSLGLALGDMDVDEDFEASMWAAFEEVISTRLRRHIVADDVARSRHVNLGGRIVHYKNLLGMWTFELTDVSVNTVIQPRALKRRRFKCQGRQELSFACSGLRIAAVDDEAVRRFLHRQWRDDAKRSAVLDSIQVVDSKIYHTRLPLLEKRAQLRKLNQSTAAIFSSVQELVDREEHPLPADRRANARAALLVDQLARGRP